MKFKEKNQQNKKTYAKQFVRKKKNNELLIDMQYFKHKFIRIKNKKKCKLQGVKST